MKLLLKIIPWFFLALFACEIIAVVMPKRDGPWHVREFGRLPVLMNGRVQPFDSVGHNTLLQIRSTGDVPLEEVPSWKFWHHGKKLKSTEWLLEVFFKPESADTRPIFLIHHPDLLAVLNLRGQGVEKSGLHYYNFEQIKPVLEEIEKQGNQARQIDEKLRTPYQKQAVKLHNAVGHYLMMKFAIRPPGWDHFKKDLADFEQTIPAGLKAIRASEAGQSFDNAALERLWTPLKQLFSLSKDTNAGQTYPLVIPPSNAEAKRDDWTSMSQALVEAVRKQAVPEPAKFLATIGSAYDNGRADEFNQGIAGYKEWLQRDFPKELKKGRNEFFYNDIKAFLHAIIIYIAAFLLAAFSLLTFTSLPLLSEALRKSAFYLILLGWLVHTFGLVFRMYLEGRPPVTNLYSSAIFIGWGAIVLGLILERIYRVGLGSVIAAFAGFVTLFIAHNLALGGDTMEMMRAVLDTNFWLSTHVVAVTIGYASTFVAGLLAILYILLGVFTPLLREKMASRTAESGPKSSLRPANIRTGTASAGASEIGKALGKMVYAIVCFATLFSFTGTVLGGIWADQSWGRFWGWDPKENGALLIVLWNALILHARWGGLVRERGLVNLAVFGNIVTSFSWFGVNMLGIGLHSYGFMDAAFKWLVAFIVTQLVIIGLGLMPLKYWRSFRSPSVQPPIPPASPAGDAPLPEPIRG